MQLQNEDLQLYSVGSLPQMSFNKYSKNPGAGISTK